MNTTHVRVKRRISWFVYLSVSSSLMAVFLLRKGSMFTGNYVKLLVSIYFIVQEYVDFTNMLETVVNGNSLTDFSLIQWHRQMHIFSGHFICVDVVGH